MNPRKEKTDLLNMHKLIGKHITKLADEAIESVDAGLADSQLEASGQRIEDDFKDLIAHYPGGLEAATADLWFYGEVLQQTRKIIVLMNFEQHLKGRKHTLADMEKQLNEMLGFR